MKLVALDVDGTLVNQDGSVALETKNALQRLYADGHKIVIATGRPIRSVLNMFQENDIDRHSGYPQAIITDERDIHLLRGGHYEMLQPHSQEAFAKEYSLLAEAHRWVRECALALEVFFYENNEYMRQSRGYLEILCRHPGVVEEALAWFDEHLLGTDLIPVRNRQLIALRWRETGKGWALSRLTEVLSVSTTNILAIGDSLNDWDMLTREWAAATTANADPEIKELINERGGHIAKQGYSLGVAELLEKLVTR